MTTSGRRVQDLAGRGGGCRCRPAPGGQVGQPLGLAGDEHVARVLARGDGGDDEVGLVDQRHRDRHVLEAVHGEVDLPREQGLLELLGEQPLAAELVQRAVGDLVAGGLEDAELDAEAGVSRSSWSATSMLCVRASRLPRVPSLRVCLRLGVRAIIARALVYACARR